MRILIDVTHPAHAHFFRAVISRLRDEGHDVLVTSRNKDVTTALLDAFEIEHRCLSRAGRSRFGLFREMIVRDWRLLRVIRKFRPDVVLAREGVFACQAAWLARVPSVSFDDTDEAKLQHKLYFPFATRVYTDEAYGVRIGTKQRFYRGVSPLAYLHPAGFEPDSSVLERNGLDPNERLILLRLVSWTANHDYGQQGFDRANLDEMAQQLSRHGRVLITSETPLPPNLEKYRVSVPPHEIHDLMAFSSLYVGESATMAAECAVLGKPAIYVSTLSTWYTQILEKPFRLLRHVNAAEDCLREAEAVLQTPDYPRLYRERRDAYLAQTDDLRQVVLSALAEVALRESRPESAHDAKHFASATSN